MTAAARWAATIRNGSRILLLGCPGAGKSTLATGLQHATRLPLVHLDDEYWLEDWQRPTTSAWIRRQEELVAQPAWIIDGNYLPTVPVRAARADLVLVIDTSTLVCLFRVVRRARRIHAGDRSALPAAVRDTRDREVRATQDFMGLIRKILLFRRRDFWPLLAAARVDPRTEIVVVVQGRRPARRMATVRSGLAARSLTGLVVDAATLRRALPDEPSGEVLTR
jgi:hypothetical protein